MSDTPKSNAAKSVLGAPSIAEMKEADRAKQFTPEQLEALGESVVSATMAGGTVVHDTASNIKKLRTGKSK